MIRTPANSTSRALRLRRSPVSSMAPMLSLTWTFIPLRRISLRNVPEILVMTRTLVLSRHASRVSIYAHKFVSRKAKDGVDGGKEGLQEGNPVLNTIVVST